MACLTFIMDILSIIWRTWWDLTTKDDWARGTHQNRAGKDSRYGGTGIPLIWD